MRHTLMRNSESDVSMVQINGIQTMFLQYIDNGFKQCLEIRAILNLISSLKQYSNL